MSLLLLFKRRWLGPNARRLGYGRAVRVAEEARRITSERRKRRKAWEEPVRRFLASVEKQLPAAPDLKAAEAPKPSPTITPVMVANLAAVFRENKEPVSLQRVESLLADLARQEAERHAFALELIAALQAMQFLEARAREDDELMLMALGAAV